MYVSVWVDVSVRDRLGLSVCGLQTGMYILQQRVKYRLALAQVVTMHRHVQKDDYIIHLEREVNKLKGTSGWCISIVLPASCVHARTCTYTIARKGQARRADMHPKLRGLHNVAAGCFVAVVFVALCRCCCL